MKVIVPMAGRGNRYANKGYDTPKPLVDIFGKPMFLWALRSLEGVAFDEVIFIILKEHEKVFGISQIIKKNFLYPYKIEMLDEVTDGQLSTVLHAKKHFKGNTDILIISSDTWVISNIGEDIRDSAADTKGLISVMSMQGEQWSFVATDSTGKAVRVAEKIRISDQASTGLYYFKSGAEFIHYAEAMIANNERTKGEFYVIPVYQKMIDDNQVVRVSRAEKMWDFGTPEAKDRFKHEFSK